MILTSKSPSSIEALEIRLNGVDYLAVPKGILLELYAAAGEVSVEPAKPIQPKPRSTPPTGHQSPMKASICELLGKRPMETSEIIGSMKGKTTAASIYTTLGEMRKTGDIETRPDENGVRKNYPRKAQA